ncbi:MAG: hypothetical protein DF168_00946 [Candidatus Moanabacter tarae]|uniref:Uncharacterized protein n=1 Tax=Candidatus Moanibacter tarae TaxID=2200854 RepID=A0A2Z4APQ7_9BACT|nr:MAG: hypothetical protein DF168_00946 [Candidatus Moanabacter tarae]
MERIDTDLQATFMNHDLGMMIERGTLLLAPSQIFLTCI